MDAPSRRGVGAYFTDALPAIPGIVCVAHSDERVVVGAVQGSYILRGDLVRATLFGESDDPAARATFDVEPRLIGRRR
jgi:hypothetical protein